MFGWGSKHRNVYIYMVFSDTTTKNGLIQTIEDYSNLADGVISGDTTLLQKTTVRVNETINDIILEIMKCQDNFDWDDPTRTDYAVATTPLFANKRDYQFDNLSFLKIKRMDVTWDGVNWHRATSFDSATFERGLGNDSQTDGFFQLTEPKYDPKSNGFWLYPRATQVQEDAGASVRIEFTRAFDPFTFDDTTKEPPIASTFHELIAIGAAMKYVLIKDEAKAKNLVALYDRGLARIREFYGRRDEDAQLVFNPIIPNFS